MTLDIITSHKQNVFPFFLFPSFSFIFFPPFIRSLPFNHPSFHPATFYLGTVEQTYPHPRYSRVPNILDIIVALTMVWIFWAAKFHCTLDIANAILSIPLYYENQRIWMPKSLHSICLSLHWWTQLTIDFEEQVLLRLLCVLNRSKEPSISPRSKNMAYLSNY